MAKKKNSKLCSICNTNKAKYTCERCGVRLCKDCALSCSSCHNETMCPKCIEDYDVCTTCGLDL